MSRESAEQLFWRLYGVSLRSDQPSHRQNHGADPLATQRASILRSCLRSSNPEPVLFEAMQLLSRLGVPTDVGHDEPKNNIEHTASSNEPAQRLRPLGCAELVGAVINQGESHVAQLFVILSSPPSSRCVDVALTLVFRCVRLLTLCLFADCFKMESKHTLTKL